PIDRQLCRLGARRSPPADGNRPITFVDDFSPDRFPVNNGWRRGRDPARPHLPLFADLPAYNAGRSAKKRRGVAPRHQLHLLSRTTAACGDGGGDGFGAEESLDVEESAGGAVIEGAVAAPEAELTALVGQHLFGHQAEQDEAGGGRVRVGACEPAVELPAHALGQGKGRRPLEAPPAYEGLA